MKQMAWSAEIIFLELNANHLDSHFILYLILHFIFSKHRLVFGSVGIFFQTDVPSHVVSTNSCLRCPFTRQHGAELV